jgi:hypothetical protein
MARVRPSRRFIESLKLHREPAYAIAWAAGVHPNTLSKLVTGQIRVRDGDVRVIAVGRQLGLTPTECFDSVDDAAQERAATA